MTSVPPPPPASRVAPPPSASDSATSTAHSPKNQVEGGAPDNGASHGDETKPDFADGLDHLDSTRYIERFRKYDDEYTKRLFSKYFSGKDLNRGNIIYEQITVRDEIIKASRFPCLRSYADPVVGFEEQSSNGSSPPADKQANIPNGTHIVKDNN